MKIKKKKSFNSSGSKNSLQSTNCSYFFLRFFFSVRSECFNSSVYTWKRNFFISSQCSRQAVEMWGNWPWLKNFSPTKRHFEKKKFLLSHVSTPRELEPASSIDFCARIAVMSPTKQKKLSFPFGFRLNSISGVINDTLIKFRYTSLRKLPRYRTNQRHLRTRVDTLKASSFRKLIPPGQ